MKFYDTVTERVLDSMISYLRDPNTRRGVDCDDTEVWKLRDVTQRWIKAGRKYYKLYPALHAALLKIPLNSLAQFPKWEPDCIEIRFPEHTPITFGEHSLRSVTAFTGPLHDTYGIGLLGIYEHVVTKKVMWVAHGFPWDAEIAPYNTPDKESPEAVRQQFARADICTERNGTSEAKDDKALWYSTCAASLALRTAIFTFMLKDDPQFVEPEVLTKDAPKWDSADANQRKIMVDRAVRRGKHGFTLGKQFETVPHFRRPHFAIRWTEKGRTVPRLTAIKGSVVHRDKLTTVPTGKYDAAGNEIEPVEAT